MEIQPISQRKTYEILDEFGVDSFVNQPNMAALLGSMLGLEIDVNKELLVLTKDEPIIIAEYIGIKLPPFVSVLPNGAMIKFYLVTLREE